MKKMRKIFIVSLFILGLIGLGEWIPYKKAIDIKHVREHKDYKTLIITEAETTGPPWLVIGNEKGLFDNPQKNQYVVLIGDLPPKKVVKNLVGYLEATNKYIIYCVSYGVVDCKLDREKYEVLWVYDWDIISPINRDASLISYLRSKRHLSIYDFL